MSIPATDPDPRLARSRPRVWRTIRDAAGWSLAGAVCASGVWAGTFLFTSALLSRPILESIVGERVLESALAWATILGSCGLLVGATSSLVLSRNIRVVTVIGLSLVAGLTGAVGGGLTPCAIAASADVHSVFVSSSLVWAVAGLLGGLVGYCWSRLTAKAPVGEDEEESPRGRHADSSAIVTAAWWALAGGISTAGAWASAFVILNALRFPPLTSADVYGHVDEAAELWALVGAGCGLLLSAMCGFLFGRDGLVRSTIGLSVGAGLSGAIGGCLTPLAVDAGGVLPPIVTSSMAWAVAGLLGGPVGYCWSHWTAETPEVADESEDASRPLAPAATRIPRAASRKRNLRPILLFAPLFTVSALSLIGAVLLAPSQVALALLAAGFVGLSAGAVTIDQERRIRELERRLRGWR